MAIEKIIIALRSNENIRVSLSDGLVGLSHSMYMCVRLGLSQVILVTAKVGKVSVHV